MHACVSVCMHVGRGPVYSLLKLLVFGDDVEQDVLSKAEEGQGSNGSTAPSSSQPTVDHNNLHYYGKLLLCIAGLQGSYLTWGVLQVSIKAGRFIIMTQHKATME